MSTYGRQLLTLTDSSPLRTSIVMKLLVLAQHLITRQARSKEEKMEPHSQADLLQATVTR